MTLTDVVKVKKLADNISFMRLFFLKNQRAYLNLRQSDQHQDMKLELIDCVLAIYLFEITRSHRTGRHLYSKDQFQYQVLHFFTNLKACQCDDVGGQGRKLLPAERFARIDEELENEGS